MLNIYFVVAYFGFHLICLPSFYYIYFVAEETLEGENMYTCEKCKAKRKSVKQLSIYKYPTVLVSTYSFLFYFLFCFLLKSLVQL